MAWQEIGRVQSVNPARRELRVACRPEALEALLEAQWVQVLERKCKVESSRDTGGDVIVALAAGVPRDLIGQMRHAEVRIEGEAFVPRPVLDWTPEDLEGMAVLNAEGTLLGRVVEVMDLPAHAVLVIETPAQERWLLPAIPEVIERLLPEAREIIVGDIKPFVVVEGEDEGAEDAH